MFLNHLKLALRNLTRSKGYSFINIGGLAIGLAVALLMCLWINDELSFNRYHKNYSRIAQVMTHLTFNGEKTTLIYQPYPMAAELRSNYSNDVKYSVMSTLTSGHVLTYEEQKLTINGNYMEAQAPEMLGLKMIKGSLDGLKDPTSIFISESSSNTFFGDADPIGKVMRIDNTSDVKVIGVYEDIPDNSDFKELMFIAPWELLLTEPQKAQLTNNWANDNWQTYVQLADHIDMGRASLKIKDIRLNKMSKENADLFKPEVFLHPMSRWHLHSEFKNGINAGGRIEYVWLFGIAGLFVLVLACINFMNLSTAQSQKRAKEVGIRKTIGSSRLQLMTQFFNESILITLLAFVLSLFLVQLILPLFNHVSDKRISILWYDPFFWLLSITFILITGIVAGLYPALYLSSFQPIKVLKGTFKTGRFSALPRKALVVLQFSVSITLIIGTIVVFRQIQFAKQRPVGYNRSGLVILSMTPDILSHFDSFQNELKKSGAVEFTAASANPILDYYVNDNRFEWKDKDPDLSIAFPINNVTYDYGKTIGWQIKEGRDFSKEFPSDSNAFILNEAAAKFMGLKSPIGEIIKWKGQPFTVIGVIKDIIFESPYQPVIPYIYQMTGDQSYVVTIKINPEISMSKALSKIETVFQRFNPAIPFDYKFIDEEFAKRFLFEERIEKLVSSFAMLAIFISCLGIFGLAAFTAEQRTKEIGIRKVLGSTIFNLWQLLSKDFVVLVIISLLIATPLAYYFMNNWLQNYEYRVKISAWIFAAAGMGALLITLLTVSFQTLKAAVANPIDSLRSE